MWSPKFSDADAYVSSLFQFRGLMEIAFSRTTIFFSFLFSGPSVFHDMITPASSAYSANFKAGFAFKSSVVIQNVESCKSSASEAVSQYR